MVWQFCGRKLSQSDIFFPNSHFLFAPLPLFLFQPFLDLTIRFFWHNREGGRQCGEENGWSKRESSVSFPLLSPSSCFARLAQNPISGAELLTGQTCTYEHFHLHWGAWLDYIVTLFLKCNFADRIDLFNWFVHASISDLKTLLFQDQDKDSLRMVGGKDRPVLKLKDMEEKHLWVTKKIQKFL